MTETSTLPTVAVIALGGTISCTPSSDLEGVAPTLGADDLMAVYGLSDAPAKVHPVTWSTRDSSEIKFDELIELAEKIRSLFDDGLDGVVVTQGTDTIDETAFALDLLLGAKQPIVVTGAMRDASRPGADGAANLWASLAVAPAAELRDLGTVVVFNDQIHLARWVRKSNTSSLDAFTSPMIGPVGWLTERRVSWVLRPTLVHPEPLAAKPDATSVALIPAVLDGNVELFAVLPGIGMNGLVVEGMGGGHTDGASSVVLAQLAQQFPVVYASRTGTGNVLQSTYDSPGAEIELQRNGLIAAGTLSGLKARILLTLLLKSGASQAEMRARFAEYDQH